MPHYLFVHGAANGPWVFDGWVENLGAPATAVDLRPLVTPRTSMADYAAEVARLVAQLPEPPVLVGWSMGGLVALMAARACRLRALVVLEPSAPAEVIGLHPELPLREGTYGPEVYGVVAGAPMPAGLRPKEWADVVARCDGAVESLYARDERARGISVSPVGAPLLVVHGDREPLADERGPEVARALGGQALVVPDASHWALVLGDRYRARVGAGIAAWLEERVP